MSVQLTDDWRKFERVLANLGNLDMAEIHKRIAARMDTNTRMRFRTGTDPEGAPWRKPKWRKGQPLRDTGVLLKSIHSKSSSAFAAVGTNNEYAKIHQFGGVIKPKTAKALAIPWSPEAKGVGYASRFPRKLALVWPKGSKSGWLVESGGSRRKHTKLPYRLRHQVTIPARPVLGISQDDRTDVAEVIQGFVKRAVR